MLDEYLNRILTIIAELRELLEDGSLPTGQARKIEAALSRMERIVELHK